MSASFEDLLDDWHGRAEIATKAFNLAANRCVRWHLILGLIVVSLTAIVGTTTFSQLNEDGNTSATLKILLGGLSVAAAVLVAVQTFAGLADRAVAYRDAARRFASVRREIEELRTAAAEGMKLGLSDVEAIRARMDDAAAVSPNAPHAIWERTRRRQQDNPTRAERAWRRLRGLKRPERRR